MVCICFTIAVKASSWLESASMALSKASMLPSSRLAAVSERARVVEVKMLSSRMISLASSETAVGIALLVAVVVTVDVTVRVVVAVTNVLTEVGALVTVIPVGHPGTLITVLLGHEVWTVTGYTITCGCVATPLGPGTHTSSRRRRLASTG